MVWPLGLKKNPGLTDRGVATGVTKFRMASDGLTAFSKSLNITRADVKFENSIMNRSGKNRYICYVVSIKAFRIVLSSLVNLVLLRFLHLLVYFLAEQVP